MGNYISHTREILGYLSYRNIIDFALFRARLAAAAKLKTGHLEKGVTTTDLTFYDGTFKYVVRFNRRRGPCPFSNVSTTLGGSAYDITDRIREFAGPSHNFYGIPTTPNMLGYENLTFRIRGDDGDDILLGFSRDSIIDLVVTAPQEKQKIMVPTSNDIVTVDDSDSGCPPSASDGGDEPLSSGEARLDER